MDEYFWSLIIEPEHVCAAIWYREDTTAKVIGIGTSEPWKNDEELVTSLDSSMSTAIESFPEETKEPSKVVFGVSPLWVSEGKIKKEYLEKIKGVCSKLSLTPSGFVVLPEAISYYVKLDEGSPLTGILIGLNERSIDISLFRLGNMIGSVNVGRSVSLQDDLVEGLARFGNDSFPSRVILYGGGQESEISEAMQSLLGVDWKEVIPSKFLHTPQLEILNFDKKIAAVSLAGASEMGEITGVSLGENKRVEVSAPEPVFEPQDKNFLGRASDAGFVVEGDGDETTFQGVDSRNDNLRSVSHESGKGRIFGGARILSGFSLKPLMVLKDSLKRVRLRRFKLPSFSFRPNLWLVVGGFLVIVLVLAVLWWTQTKANVVVYPMQTKVSASYAGFVDLEASSIDFSNNVIPGKSVDVVVSGERTRSATGSKVVGEKARGQVKIRNGTSSAVSLNAGASVTSSNDLSFLLNESVTVPAATSPTTPGDVVVEVTASEIGAEYNLAKDEGFGVSNYPKSEVDAVSENDFSGGSSHEATVVSQDDLDSLEDELLEELLDKAKKELGDKISPDDHLISDSLSSETLDRTFSHKVNDETTSIRLSMEVGVTGAYLTGDTFAQILRHASEGKISSGFILKEDQVEYEIETFDASGGYDANFDFTLGLIPEIDTDEIKRALLGKSSEQAKRYLESSPGFSRAEINLNPFFVFGFLDIVPLNASNVKVEVSAL